MDGLGSWHEALDGVFGCAQRKGRVGVRWREFSIVRWVGSGRMKGFARLEGAGRFKVECSSVLPERNQYRFINLKVLALANTNIFQPYKQNHGMP